MLIEKFTLTAQLDCTAESMEKFIGLCEGAIAAITEDSQARFLLKTAVDELTLNALEHGYGGDSGSVSVSMELRGGAVLFEISDSGKGIDPNKINFDRLALSENDLSSRGWAFSILNSLSKGVEITSNFPNGSRIQVLVPLKNQDIEIEST